MVIHSLEICLEDQDTTQPFERQGELKESPKVTHSVSELGSISDSATENIEAKRPLTPDRPNQEQ